ncbi:peptidase inhibitor family I36 protein [Actinokineospora sp. NPDC004072]
MIKSLAAVALAVAGVLTVPQAASADEVGVAAVARNGVCEPGEFCLFHGFDFTGSVSDFNTSIPNYGTTQPSCYEFKGDGEGKGECVKNNALSGYNYSNRSVRLYYNSNYGGTSITFAPLDGLDGGLGPLDHENASHKFL